MFDNSGRKQLYVALGRLRTRLKHVLHVAQNFSTLQVSSNHSSQPNTHVYYYNRMLVEYIHCVSKKFPPLYSVTLSNLNRLSHFLQCWKAYEICYKPIRHYPPHLKRVATLPRKIKNLNFWPPVNCACVPQRFYRATACNATHGIAVAILSVCLSVHPSVCLSDACIVAKLNDGLRIF